eukprot:TRINITY_DN12889_c0_g1_i1.p1 TRINITY_DN12889_c0_g1~~TRINITY_DN12889_c0_g1_i1.p1  ORF type:complete len:763 (+),score=250.82 TRINITY_DN12889_c0_g1_i1:58-2346(+)
MRTPLQRPAELSAPEAADSSSDRSHQNSPTSLPPALSLQAHGSDSSQSDGGDGKVGCGAVDGIVAGAARVIHEFPSVEFSRAVRPSAGDPIEAEIPAELWEGTVGLLCRTGVCGEKNLRSLRKGVARQAYAGMEATARSLHAPVAFSSGSAAAAASVADPSGQPRPPRPTNASTVVGGALHSVFPMRFHTEGGFAPTFVGTCSLNGSDDPVRTELMSSCITSVWADEDSRNPPVFIFGRSGRADTAKKARQLLQMAQLVISRSPPEPSPPGRAAPPLRLLFCSLLNALPVDRRERDFFRRQLGTLCTPLSRSPRPHSLQPPASSPTRPRCSASTAMHPPEPLFEHRDPEDSSMMDLSCASMAAMAAMCDESMASMEADDGFDFPAGVAQLGAEFAYLNYSANWPLSFRLGAKSAHNARHPHALRTYLRWAAIDTLAVLQSLPPDAPGVGRVRAQLEHVAELGEDAVWTDGLARLRAAVAVVVQAAADDRARAAAQKLFIACELLGRMSANRAANYRHRAGEMLQLCILNHVLGVIPFTNCKSGIDRAGVISALWTTFNQLLVREQPSLWLWFYLSVCYPVVVKTVHRVHGCGLPETGRQVPMQQMREGLDLDTAPITVLPFMPDGGQKAAVEELCHLVGPRSHARGGRSESRAYAVLETLFFSDGKAILPQLQCGFLANQLGVTTKVAAASTGAFGLKYGESGPAFNALAAQFYPRKLRSADGAKSITLTQVRGGIKPICKDVAVAAEAVPMIVGVSSARGT